MTSKTPTTSTLATAVDLYAQALKSLSERCPFEEEEIASRATTLPFRVAARLSKYSDGRRKFKKSTSAHGEQAVDTCPNVSKQSKGPSLWDEMEAYFRLITVADIESLRNRGLNNSCFTIPAVEGSLEELKKDLTFSGSELGVNSEGVNEEEASGKVEVAVREVEQPMEMDAVGNFGAAETSTLPVREAEERGEEDGPSMNWVVGSKHRAVLTTQRPTKKRKLLGSDAGLDQLLELPHSQQASARCDVCCLGENSGKSNKIVSCSSCRVLVHKKCYGLHGAVEEPWMCSMCKLLQGMSDEKRGEQTGSRPCLLCPKEGGALKPVAGNNKSVGEKDFVHLFCCLWSPEVYVENTEVMEPVVNVEGIPEMRMRLVCNVCKVKHGACIRCSFGKFDWFVFSCI